MWDAKSEVERIFLLDLQYGETLISQWDSVSNARFMGWAEYNPNSMYILNDAGKICLPHRDVVLHYVRPNGRESRN